MKSNTQGYLTGDTLGYMFIPMKTNTFAERLKLAMNEGGFTQASLAEAAGIAQPSIWKITSGKTKSSAKTVEIASALNVRPEWLATGSGPMRDQAPLSVREEPAQYIVKRKDHNVFTISLWDENGETGDVMVVPDGVKTESSRAYKLRHDSGYTEAPAGSMIVVDPAEKPWNNDFVYARVNGSDSVYKFIADAGNGFLALSEPRAPLIPVSEEAKIIGVITYLSRSFRR